MNSTDETLVDAESEHTSTTAGKEVDDSNNATIKIIINIIYL